jgi:hypothetical protein
MKLQIPRHGQRHHRAGGGAYDEPGVWDGSTLSFVISLSSTNFVQLGLWNERLSAAWWITRHLGKAACHQLQSLAEDPCAPVSGLSWLCFSFLILKLSSFTLFLLDGGFRRISAHGM